jgi:AcrR family transcriptional regulator
VSSKPKPDYGNPKTREQVIEAARQVLIERGAALRLRDVADRAAVSRQALYLHFGDREGLILALVRHIDEELELDLALEHVHAAETGADLLERVMRLNTEFWGKVAPVAVVLNRSKGEDNALHAAWRDRMAYRRSTFRRIADDLRGRGELAEAWKPEDAADVLFSITHFDSWSELTQELGWTDDRYVEAMTRLLTAALLRN